MLTAAALPSLKAEISIFIVQFQKLPDLKAPHPAPVRVAAEAVSFNIHYIEYFCLPFQHTVKFLFEYF